MTRTRNRASSIDPGGDVDVILQTIAENDLTIEAIWLTHGHIDHAGGADELREKLRLPIIGPHEADLPLLSGLEEQAKMFGLEMDAQCHARQVGEGRRQGSFGAI